MPEKVLAGKVALVTGAGSGLGQALAIGLSQYGAELALVGRRRKNLQETMEMIGRQGGKATLYTVDVCQKEEVQQLAEQVLNDIGTPALLINAAGMYGETKPFSESDPEIWIQTMMTNTIGPYLICRSFVGSMIQAGWGRIINISSAASLDPPRASNSAYATSKVALNHFTRQLADELAGTGVTANVMHPGEVMTEMFDQIRQSTNETGDMADWVNWVEETGGDSPQKSLALILDLIKPQSAGINGRFLWIENGLRDPLPSWE